MESIIIKNEYDIKVAREAICITCGSKISMGKTYLLGFNKIKYDIYKNETIGDNIDELPLEIGDMLSIHYDGKSHNVVLIKKNSAQCENIRRLDSSIFIDTNILYDSAIVVETPRQLIDIRNNILKLLGENINYIDLGNKLILMQNSGTKLHDTILDIKINDKVFISKTSKVVTILR